MVNGSRLGGSLRIPASFCGVVGLRPSLGVVPRGDGLPAFDSLWVDGPIARNVPDLALMLDAMAELTPHDPLSRAVPLGGYQAAMTRGRLPRRVSFSADLGLRKVDPEVAALCAAAARHCTSMGTEVDQASAGFRGRDRLLPSAACSVVRRCPWRAIAGRAAARSSPGIVWNMAKGRALTAGRDDAARSHSPSRCSTTLRGSRCLRCPALSDCCGVGLPYGARFPTEIGARSRSPTSTGCS